ncbi:MAG: hypothetical protein H6706_15305 [Myxococcales bacterium]|nr:hypothetical protein [Myxococcales bacterium]
MAVTWQQAVQHYEQRQAEAEEVIAEYERLRTVVVEQIRVVHRQLGAARTALAAACLPALEATGIARAERLTGFRGFSRRDPFEVMAHRRSVLERTVARIQGDERYQRRVGLVGGGGELTEKLAEVRDTAGPFEEACTRFEELPRFQELIDAGYDTPQFNRSWWQADYWKLWAAGDKICSLLGMRDFGDDVRPAYLAAVKERDFWREEVTRVERLIADVHRLVAEHDRAQGTLSNLTQVILEECWQALAEFFEHADLPLLDTWLSKETAEDRGIRMALRRVAGLDAKEKFLRELQEQGLQPRLNDLDNRRRKYMARLRKLRTSSKMRTRAISPSWLDHRFGAKKSKLLGEVPGIERQVARVVAYEKYDRFQLSDSPRLWWVTFTGSRPPRLLPATRGWYDRNPDATPSVAAEEIVDLNPAVAVVVRGSTDVDAGYLS